ncbi:response regulator transcription factor [Rhodococcoides fascians]|jgi:DNA-binding NarL/FixJ family response regulator|uniref:Transcriptional regulatory protein LiaR n=1 Tax=Rhodococcoides fascians TaxID=1828 RepID=A0A143QLK7_RHOFA|nr:response regulator transcription factor [Rhodococcus fascians]AMY23940.1 Transcriptional regulatory protein LiaR [Rhodococcus fascians]KMJ48325.1 LuxR family transcriptional regulator [Rhodococcus fascians]OZC43025.1 DNA-binding response regulator [Rhodococcus fascians]
MSIRIVIADDQASVREALATMLDLIDDITVVSTATDGDGAVAAVQAAMSTESLDVVLMDLRMPGTDGIEATRILKGLFPDLPVVVLTTFSDERSILDALGAGARGYLTKDAGRVEIAAALRAAAAGQAVLNPEVQARLLGAIESPRAQQIPAGLTPREVEVLRAIAAGLSNREIAQQMFVSEATVKTHINHLFAKARLRDRAQAVHFAFTHGLAG